MKKRLFSLWFLVVAVTQAFVWAQTALTDIPAEFDPGKAPGTLRILTYNIRVGYGFNDLDDPSGLDLEAVGNVISAIKPDYAGIQEVDRNNGRSEGKDQIQVIGEMAGLHSYYGKAIDFDGGQYGIGALSAENAVSFKRVPLPIPSEADRVLIEMEFEDFVFFNTHLSLTAEYRADAAAIINNELSHSQKPVILTGDLNVSGYEEYLTLFGDRWTVLSPEEPSFPSDTPNARLDYILIADPKNRVPLNSPIWKESVVRSEVVPTVASDHRPVFIDLNFEKIKSAINNPGHAE